MRKIILIFLIATGIKTSNSQSTWFWQQPLPTGNFLYSVDFANEQTGYAAGTVGTIMKTTDGGGNWSLKNINTTLYLSSVSVADNDTVLAANRNIYRTSNGGDNWTQVYTNTGNLSIFLDFPTRSTGYAAGGIGIILKSTNGGINWVSQTSPVSQAFYDVSFSDSLQGMISTFRGVLTTTNGGSNWNYTDFNLESFDLVASCSQTDSQNLFAITTFDYFFRSTNGGVNWSSSLLPVDFANIPRQCSFSDGNKGYIVTSWGNILRTTNSGVNWETDSTFQPDYYQINVLWGVQALNNNTIFVCGAGGIIGKSTDGGNSWFAATGGGTDLESNYFVNENTGYTVGFDGLILKTTNGGTNWIQQSSKTSQNLNDVIFVNENIGYVCGDTGTVLKTTNGGSEWDLQITDINSNLNCIYFINESFGLSAGRNSKIMRTTNGGLNWDILTLTPTIHFTSIYIFNIKEAIVASTINTYRSTNSGLNWVLDYALGGIDYEFTDSVTGYNAGGSGSVIKTTNKGIGWIIQNVNISGVINSVSFINNNNGYAVSEEGNISKTTNGGLSWLAQTKFTDNSLNSIYFVNANTGYIVGNFGTLIKTTNGGLVFISSNNSAIPENHSLSQNYPNPFNSSTIIKYHLRNSAKVKINLYNIEGKITYSIVDHYQNAGIYEILFDASELSNGVFFYTLSIDNKFIDSKKLLIIK